MGSLHLEDDLLEDNQPFPTLRLALDTLDAHLGFNIEIKWTMQLQVNVAGILERSSCCLRVVLLACHPLFVALRFD